MDTKIANPRTIIIFSALACALVVGMTSYSIMQIYENEYPVWVEQAAYGQWPMVKFQSLIEQQGIVQAIQISLTTNDILLNRHLFEIWMLGVLAPGMLGWFHAPLLVVIPIFLIFLALFGWTVYKRTGNTIYSVTAMLLFCGLAQLTRHDWGIGSGFADWQSMFLLSSSVLCLINAFAQPGLGWIRAFAVFLALAVLARITVVFYAVVVCGPPLLYYLIFVYKKTPSLKSVFITLANILIIVGPLIVLTLLRLPNLFTYYGSSNAWNLKQSLADSASNIFLVLLKPFIGLPLLVVCFLLLLLNIIRDLPDLDGLKGRRFVQEFSNISLVDKTIRPGDLVLLWWCFGFLGFLLVNGYTSDVPKEVMYAVPPFLLICIAPFSYKKIQHGILINWLIAGIMLFSLADFALFAYQNAQYAGMPRPDQTAMRQTQYDMASALSKFSQDVAWQSYTRVDWGMPVSLLTQYEHSNFQVSRGWYFYNRKEYWDTWYPGLTAEELQEKLYLQTSDCIDVAVILLDPGQKPSGMEDYSYSIAAFMARRIQSDVNWQYIDRLNDSSQATWYGIYQNKHAIHSDSCLK